MITKEDYILMKQFEAQESDLYTDELAAQVSAHGWVFTTIAEMDGLEACGLYGKLRAADNHRTEVFYDSMRCIMSEIVCPKLSELEHAEIRLEMAKQEHAFLLEMEKKQEAQNKKAI